jgi:hypothetical protein
MLGDVVGMLGDVVYPMVMGFVDGGDDVTLDRGRYCHWVGCLGGVRRGRHPG